MKMTRNGNKKRLGSMLVFLLLSVISFAQHRLQIQYAGKDSAFDIQQLKMPASFPDAAQANAFIQTIPSLMRNLGYPAASVDSVWVQDNLSTVMLYTGKRYRWIRLVPDSIEKKALDQAGFMDKHFSGKLLNFSQLQLVQDRILNWYENNGYPFAAVFLDSITLDDDRMHALLKARKGPLYHIDSLRVLGKAKISKHFLEQYLGIPAGSPYNGEKIKLVGRRILELPYIEEMQPADVTMLGSGSVLNLYLQPKRSSQFNFLVGFLPSSGIEKKLQVTGDVNLDLKNALGSGERIYVNWQQLQAKSPRLNLAYSQPYIFKTPFGLDFAFDLFKKDSTFIQVNAQAGVQYLLSASQAGKLFVQWQNSFLLANGIDTNQVIATKRLPPNIDVNSVNVGIDYEFSKTDYKLNPRSGNEARITTTVGVKNIKRSNDILNIKDPSFNYASLYDSLKARSYQFRVRLTAAHYFPVGKQGTFKTGLYSGIYSSQATFRNDLFQIGGYKLLRGFNEESIYATQYVTGTLEYRYRLRLNSNIFAFIDGGWARIKFQDVNVSNSFIGGGLGMLIEMKLGLLNLSYAIGKRNDVEFNLREASKIHFGYINYF